MGQSKCLALVSLLLLVPCLFFVFPAAATALHPDGVAFGGRRSLLQATPPPRTATPPATPPVTPPSQPTPPVTTPTPMISGAIPPAAAPTTRTPTPTPVATPGPALVPISAPAPAPAPAPIGVANSQRRNAIIAAGVIGSVLLVALVFIFCRCRCLKRSKKLPFQRLQMT